jgi:hypothetical protein
MGAAATEVTAETLPTKVLVRAVAHDAKVIGDAVGGAEITIREVGSGRVLAKGIQTGSTGSTKQIIEQPRKRGTTVFDTPGTAGFLAELQLAEPTVVEVVAVGPLGTPQSKQRASTTLLLLPGEDVLGDGIVLYIHGFTVALQKPEPRSTITAGQELRVRVRVTMTCGCTLEPAGHWDADRVRIVARLIRDGRGIAETPLRYAGETSTFEGRLVAPEAGPTELVVLALDPERANFGQVKQSLNVGP